MVDRPAEKQKPAPEPARELSFLLPTSNQVRDDSTDNQIDDSQRTPGVNDEVIRDAKQTMNTPANQKGSINWVTTGSILATLSVIIALVISGNSYIMDMRIERYVFELEHSSELARLAMDDTHTDLIERMQTQIEVLDERHTENIDSNNHIIRLLLEDISLSKQQLSELKRFHL